MLGSGRDAANERKAIVNATEVDSAYNVYKSQSGSSGMTRLDQG